MHNAKISATAGVVVADSLVTHGMADSALHLLDSLRPTLTTADRATRAYLDLLTVKASDKAYLPLTSDSLLLGVLHYYEDEAPSKIRRHHLSEAYYYAGRIYRDLGDAPHALSYFQKAIETAQNDSTSLNLQGYIYSQMGTIYNRCCLYAEAIDCNRNSLALNNATHDTIGMIYNLCDLGRAYHPLDSFQVAIGCYDEAEYLALRVGDTALAYVNSGQKALVLCDMDMPDAAKTAMLPYLKRHIPANDASVFYVASRVYYENAEYDSAEYYFQKLLTIPSIENRQFANLGLTNIAIRRKDVDGISAI